MPNVVKWPRNWLFICLLLSSFNVCAQTDTAAIKGKVGDAGTHAILPDASLSLLHLPDSMVVRRAVSGKEGFLFNRLKPGNYLLYISNMGYRDTLISIKARDTMLNIHTIWLNSTYHALVEVVVKAIIPPVITKSDTLVYDPNAFKTRPNATVEELLKKLPGMEVDRDGNITIQGEQVQKIFIDGKEFFLNDPKLATQNLLADMVDKVEAFNEKSDKAKLTGIPDPKPGKVINLRLKPDKKKGLFGITEGGLASQNRYGIKATANHFKGDMYLSVAGNSSNGGNLQGGGGTLHNKVNDLSINYRNTFNEKWQLTASYRGTGNNTSNAVSSQRQTFLQDSALLHHKETQTAGKQQNHSVNTMLQYTIDSFSSISSVASFNLSDNGNNNKDLTASGILITEISRAVNDARTDNNRTGNGWNGSFGFSYHRRFKKRGRYLGIGLNKGNSQSKGQGSLKSLTRFYSETGVITDSLERDQLSLQNGHGQNYGVNITYTEPIAPGQVIDISWSLGNSGSASAQEALNYNPVTGKYDSPDSIASNSFESRNNNQQVAVGYNYFRKKLQWQAGVALARNNQLNKDLSGHQPDIRQAINNFYPRASLIYSISKQKNLQVSYNGRNRPPSIQELQPLPDYSNPLLIRLGNPALKQEFSNEIRMSYRDFSARKARSLFGQLQFSNTAHKIVNATHINSQGAQEQQFVNLNGNYNVGTNIDYRISLGKGTRKGSIGLNSNIRYDNEANLVNEEINIRKALTWRQSARLEYDIGDKFVASSSAGFNGNWSGYSLDGGKIATLFSHFYNAYLLYDLPGAITVSTDINLIYNEAQQHLPGTQAAVWNASIMKRLFKSQAGELKLSVFDILNNSNNFSQVTGDNYIETTERQVLKRVFALSFRYNFRINRL